MFLSIRHNVSESDRWGRVEGVSLSAMRAVVSCTSAGKKMRAIGFVLSCLAISVMTDSIPEQFIGRFKVDRSENFDEFLSAKGVGFITRQLIKLASVTKVFSNGPSEGAYTFENLSSKKNVKYDFKLGEPFTGEGLDSTQHEVTFNHKDGEVSEHHKRLDSPEFTPETYYYTMSDDNKELIMRMTNNGITCKRFFKRQDA